MKLKLTLTALVLVALAATAHAQGGSVSTGCDSSPENPTAILAMAGSVGAFVAMARDRWNRRNRESWNDYAADRS